MRKSGQDPLWTRPTDQIARYREDWWTRFANRPGTGVKRSENWGPPARMSDYISLRRIGKLLMRKPCPSKRKTTMTSRM